MSDPSSWSGATVASASEKPRIQAAQNKTERVHFCFRGFCPMVDSRQARENCEGSPQRLQGFRSIFMIPLIQQFEEPPELSDTLQSEFGVLDLAGFSVCGGFIIRRRPCFQRSGLGV
jgi:hypothetical protein